MPDTLLIHVPDPSIDLSDATVQWCLTSVRPELGAIPMVEAGSLAEAGAKAGGKRVVVALGCAAVTLAYATVPGGRRGLAAVPFALEEELADDVEDLHFALGPAESDGTVPVAVVNRDALRRVVDAVHAAGMHPREIVPDVQCLPLGESDEWEVWFDDTDALIRQGRHAGLWCQRALLETLLPRLIAEAGESAPAQITWFCDDALHLPELPLLADRISSTAAIGAFARGLSSQRINLLQGEFSPRQQLGNALRPWRVPVTLAAVLALCAVVAGVLELRQLTAIDANQRAQMVELYKRAFPNARSVQEPVGQLRSRLKALKQGGEAGALDLLAVLGEALSDAPGSALNSVNYRQGRADVEIVVRSLQELDRLKSLIEQGGRVRATVRSANQQQGGVRGRLRLEARA
ncbi:MAG: type II secretion system protein GspL [Pseudomonadota bacterium]